MIDLNRLQAQAAEYNISLSHEQLAKIDIYAEMLVEWNKKMNLTAITQPQEMEQKHFLDCLLLADMPEIEGSVVDVGSGAGFPGMVAMIYKPELKVTLMEPTGKRVKFLQALANALGLQVDVLKERAEEAARKKWREQFDVATARAVASLPALCEYCLPLVKVGGVFIAMKGNASEELALSHAAISKLGGEYSETRKAALPDGSIRESIIIKKTKQTPAVYPRNGGKIAKAPL